MKIAYSIQLKRPGCALLQAAFGCGTTIANSFPPETWIVGAGLETLQVFEVNEGQLKRLVEITKEEHQKLKALKEKK